MEKKFKPPKEKKEKPKPRKVFIKKFKPKLLKIFDAPARAKLKHILGPLIEDHPDPYAADFLLHLEGCKYKFLEIQVCAAWKDKCYPYDEFTVPERKGRYGKDTLLLTLSRDFMDGYLFDSTSLDSKTLRRVRKYSREFVFVIPWNQTCRVWINTLDADTLKLF